MIQCYHYVQSSYLQTFVLKEYVKSEQHLWP